MYKDGLIRLCTSLMNSVLSKEIRIHLEVLRAVANWWRECMCVCVGGGEGSLIVGVFTSFQNLRSYQDEYRLVTVHTPGDFIVLPH